MGKLQPVLDCANATSDETILLETAKICDEANLPTLAIMYRKRAGVRNPTEREIKKSLSERALQIIKDKKRATPKDLQHALGLNRREWYGVASILRKSGKVIFVHKNEYMLSPDRLL
jgi:hypothetical protein